MIHETTMSLLKLAVLLVVWYATQRNAFHINGRHSQQAELVNRRVDKRVVAEIDEFVVPQIQRLEVREYRQRREERQSVVVQVDLTQRREAVERRRSDALQLVVVPSPAANGGHQRAPVRDTENGLRHSYRNNKLRLRAAFYLILFQ